MKNPELEIYLVARVREEAEYELRGRLMRIVNQGRLSESAAQEQLEVARLVIETKIRLVEASSYSSLEAEARKRIPRDPDDWPTVAAALALPAAIWTQDYDFFGCGCPTWTTETLLLQLRDE
jgi:predicted nucleic acid-binding protein